MRIYLAMPLPISADRAERMSCVRAARAVGRFYEAGGSEPVYPHGRCPSDQTDAGIVAPAEEVWTIARRMIAGDGAIHPSPGAFHALDWSKGSEDVDQQIDLAIEAGLSPLAIHPDEVHEIVRAGLSKALPTWKPDTPRDERPMFNCALAVVFAFVSGAEELLGARALPIEPRAGGPASPFAFMARAEEAGLRISMATKIVRRAEASPAWPQFGEEVLRFHYGAGHSLPRVAELLGLAGNANTVKSLMLRTHNTALGLIAEAMPRGGTDAQS